MKLKFFIFISTFSLFFSCNTNNDYPTNDLEINNTTSYIIKYENNGYGQKIEDKKVLSNTILTSEYLPPLESDGMFFRGWLLNDNEINNDTRVTTDITLYADWCNIVSISDGICTKVKNLNPSLLKDIGITTIYIMDANPTQSLIISNLENINKEKQKIKLNFSFWNKESEIKSIKCSDGIINL
ncbi:MAG: InlB B-repeat-containing protein [Treponema sp.]|nr:InlB B-repeat-containing protein [Treponema sp.]